MLDELSFKQQIPELLEHYPNLQVGETDSSGIRLIGCIDVYRDALGFILNKSYAIKIEIPLDGYTLPRVIDSGNAIDTNYPHRYLDGALCLETEAAIHLRFINQFNLTQWIDEYVETYFFSYEYWKRYGIFPFGERPHGLNGILHTYQEIFNETDDKKLAKIMMYIYYGNSYRGHLLCPCESGKKLRQCHGKAMYPFLTDKRYQAILSADINNIMSAIKEQKENGDSRKNQKKTK